MVHKVVLKNKYNEYFQCSLISESPETIHQKLSEEQRKHLSTLGFLDSKKFLCDFEISEQMPNYELYHYIGSQMARYNEFFQVEYRSKHQVDYTYSLGEYVKPMTMDQC